MRNRLFTFAYGLMLMLGLGMANNSSGGLRARAFSGELRHRSGSLLPAILVHVVFNAFAAIL